MQFAKDSFYMALRERLGSLNPARTVMVDGATRPTVIVAENELPSPASPLPDAFYIDWGSARVVQNHAGSRALAALDCVISYCTSGTTGSEVDRGRTLGTLGGELFSICQPPQTRKQDFTRIPSVDLGTSIFWTLPELSEIRSSLSGALTSGGDAGRHARMERRALLTVFFFFEVTLL